MRPVTYSVGPGASAPATTRNHAAGAPATTSPGVNQGVLGFFKRRLDTYLARQRAYGELMAFDDRQLADLGIGRWQVADAVSGRLRKVS